MAWSSAERVDGAGCGKQTDIALYGFSFSLIINANKAEYVGQLNPHLNFRKTLQLSALMIRNKKFKKEF